MKEIIIVLCVIGILSCREKGQERVADAGKVVGETAGNAVKSIKAGIEKVSKINIETSEILKAKGISTGKTTLGSEGGGRHNKLSVYMIFDKAVIKNVIMKVYDSQNEEIGRTKLLIKGQAGDAKYIDFIFDKHTNIDRDNKIILDAP